MVSIRQALFRSKSTNFGIWSQTVLFCRLLQLHTLYTCNPMRRSLSMEALYSNPSDQRLPYSYRRTAIMQVVTIISRNAMSLIPPRFISIAKFLYPNGTHLKKKIDADYKSTGF